MRLEKASYKAIKYSCLNFHYSKSIPAICTGYSVFNNSKEFCGTILFGLGASPHIGRKFNLKTGQIIELVRVALNGKQENTSKCLSIAINLVKKNMPVVKLIISFADKDKDHTGIIYQATNWYYLGECNVGDKTGYIINGIKTHQRSMMSKGRYRNNTLQNAKTIDKDAVIFYTKGKYKYVYPIDKSLISYCKSLSKPYPKKEKCDNSITANAADFQSAEGGQHDLVAL